MGVREGVIERWCQMGGGLNDSVSYLKGARQRKVSVRNIILMLIMTVEKSSWNVSFISEML